MTTPYCVIIDTITMYENICHFCVRTIIIGMSVFVISHQYQVHVGAFCLADKGDGEEGWGRVCVWGDTELGQVLKVIKSSHYD